MRVKQRERLFDMLTAPGAGVWAVDDPAAPLEQSFTHWRAVADIERQIIRDAVRVVADSAAAWFWRPDHGADEWDIRSAQNSFGPMAAPFPNMWIEWRMPDELCCCGRDSHETVSLPVSFGGVILMGTTASDAARRLRIAKPPQAATAIFLRPYGFEGSRLTQPPGSTAVWLTDQGHHVRSSYYSETPTMAISEWQTTVWNLAQTALLALSIMNCRNVTLTEVQRPSVQYKRQRRPRPEHLSYHVLDLPRPTGTSAQGMSDSLGGGVALHKVRGHFKTYTAERPMFGRDVGTYWVPWHTRGTADQGRVESSYRVVPK